MIIPVVFTDWEHFKKSEIFSKFQENLPSGSASNISFSSTEMMSTDVPSWNNYGTRVRTNKFV